MVAHSGGWWLTVADGGWWLMIEVGGVDGA
jgi:hypothetical protein